MFAVVRTGGKQYRVAAGDKIVVEKMDGAAGDTIALSDVLMAGDGGELVAVGGLTVSAEIIAQAKADKIIIFKKKRRHNYRRKNGHRQQHTILKILAVGNAPAESAANTSAKRVKAPIIADTSAGDVAPALDASNLSLISGIGPTIEKKLRGGGIATWNDIAGWSDADIERTDTELKLGGRAVKENWVQQAKDLLAGKPPRAKADRAELASGKDK